MTSKAYQQEKNLPIILDPNGPIVAGLWRPETGEHGQSTKEDAEQRDLTLQLDVFIAGQTSIPNSRMTGKATVKLW